MENIIISQESKDKWLRRSIKTEEKNKKRNPVRSCLRVLSLRRYVLVALVFMGLFNVFMLRVNLSVAIVAMTENHPITSTNGTVIQVKDIAWGSIEKGYVMSAFFYGYITTQLLGGWLATRFGGVNIFGMGMILTTLLTFLTPSIARFNVYFMIATRVLVGAFEGVSTPSVAAVRARWSPPDEITLMGAITQAGTLAGTCFTMAVSGLLTEKFGWPSVFYFTGIIGVVCCITWFSFAKDSPENDIWISDEEKDYLKKVVGNIEYKVAVPWKKVLTSPPVLASSLANLCESWGYITLYTQLPTFFNDVHNFNVKNAGLYSAMPYLGTLIVLPSAGYWADKMIRNKSFTVTQVRKAFVCIPFVIQIIFTLLAAYSFSPVTVMLLLSVAVSLGKISLTTINSNDLEIAPKFAGVVMGVSNTFYTLGGVLAPTYAGYIVANKNVNEWRVVFFTSCTIYVIGFVVYGIFGSGKKQKWAM